MQKEKIINYQNNSINQDYPFTFLMYEDTFEKRRPKKLFSKLQEKHSCFEYDPDEYNQKQLINNQDIVEIQPRK